MEVALLVAKVQNMGVVFCENFDTRIFMGCFCNLRIYVGWVSSLCFVSTWRTIDNIFFNSSALSKMKFGDNMNEWMNEWTLTSKLEIWEYKDKCRLFTVPYFPVKIVVSFPQIVNPLKACSQSPIVEIDCFALLAAILVSNLPSA